MPLATTSKVRGLELAFDPASAPVRDFWQV